MFDFFLSFFLIFVIVIIVTIVGVFLVLVKKSKWDKKIESGQFESELHDTINKRLQEEGNIKYDFFSENKKMKAAAWNIKSWKYWSAFNDLFDENEKLIAVSEIRYTSSIGFMSGINGVFLTKTKNDVIKTKIKKGIFYVYLNDVYIGSVNFGKKEILDEKNRKIGSIEYPSVFPRGLVEVLWHVYFNDKKYCSLVASLPFIESNVAGTIPTFKYDITKFHGSMTKKQKAFLIPLMLFIKIKQNVAGKA